MSDRFHTLKSVHVLELREKTIKQTKPIHPAMFLNFHLPENICPVRTQLYSPPKIAHSFGQQKGRDLVCVGTKGPRFLSLSHTKTVS